MANLQSILFHIIKHRQFGQFGLQKIWVISNGYTTYFFSLLSWRIETNSLHNTLTNIIIY